MDINIYEFVLLYLFQALFFSVIYFIDMDNIYFENLSLDENYIFLKEEVVHFIVLKFANRLKSGSSDKFPVRYMGMKDVDVVRLYYNYAGAEYKMRARLTSQGYEVGLYDIYVLHSPKINSQLTFNFVPIESRLKNPVEFRTELGPHDRVDGELGDFNYIPMFVGGRLKKLIQANGGNASGLPGKQLRAFFVSLKNSINGISGVIPLNNKMRILFSMQSFICIVLLGLLINSIGK